MSQVRFRGPRGRDLALLACLAALSAAGACLTDDPSTALEVTTTVTPSVVSIARDTLGMRIIVRVRNPQSRSVKVVTRPGRALLRGAMRATSGPSGPRGSWGAGFGVMVDPDSGQEAFWANTMIPAPEGRAYVFEPGQTLSDTIHLDLRGAPNGGTPMLQPGRYVLHGTWNTIIGAGVPVEVRP